MDRFELPNAGSPPPPPLSPREICHIDVSSAANAEPLTECLTEQGNVMFTDGEVLFGFPAGNSICVGFGLHLCLVGSVMTFDGRRLETSKVSRCR